MNKLAYVCAPLRPDKEHAIDQHIAFCYDYAKKIANKGYVPIVPHFMFPFLDDRIKAQRDWALEADLEILKRCDILFVCTNKQSEGMNKEIEFAIENGIEVSHV
ncbi:MAG: DUF4406 domain-containing protein [Coriobacteriia bacterium]|nr:DUF4406 domain-containing protein [Coriobacteriia bacterium]